MTYTHATYCPGCIVQFYVKIPDTFENCLRSGGTQGGGNVNKTVNFNAPNEPVSITCNLGEAYNIPVLGPVLILNLGTNL